MAHGRTQETALREIQEAIRPPNASCLGGEAGLRRVLGAQGASLIPDAFRS